MLSQFKPRIVAVYGTGFSFLVMALSGATLMIAPQGRLANSIGWRFAGLDRAGWEAVHNTTAFAFVGCALWHLVVHWSVVRTFLFGVPGRPATHRPEAVLVLALVALLVTTAVVDVPPASWIVALNTYFRHGFWGAAL